MKKNLYWIISSIITFIGTLIFFSTRWTLSTFGDVSIEEIIFNLKVPMAGVNTDYIVSFIKECLVPSVIITLIIAIILFVFFKLLCKITANAKQSTRTLILKIKKLVSIMLSILIFILACHNTIKKLDIKSYIENEMDVSTFIEDNYVNPDDVKITFPENKRNLIYIYLESMEYTFALKENGGAFDKDVIPSLSALAQNNVNFSSSELIGGLIPAYGSTWTMGALFAQTTGLPLKLPIYGNNMGQYSLFMPGVKTLGTILDENGYNNMLMIGSDANYAGRSNYFLQHGNYDIWDYNSAIENNKIPEDYYEWWGYEDNKLFEYAKEKLTNVSKDKPFNFTLLTADTHFEDGYLCSTCEDTFENDQYSNVISCSDKHVNEFIKWIQEQDFYDNTSIIIVGDHTTMDVDYCENVSEDYQRGVFNTFINVPFENVDEKNNFATTMDMFPTALASIGATIEGDRLGLGTNLFSSKKTILEEMDNDINKLNDQLKKKSVLYNNTFLYGKENNK